MGVSNPYGGVPDPRPRRGPGGYPYPDQSYPGQSYPSQSYPNQPYPGQPYPGQPYPGQPYPGQPYPSQSYPGQPVHGIPPYQSAPYAPGRPGATGPAPAQRPAVIGISASMTVTASLLWIVLLIFLLLVAAAAKQQLSYSAQPEAALYHIADEFQVVMGNGLALWLFGLPLVAAVAGFLLLVPRGWARIAYSALGALTVGWSLFWLHDRIGWWVPTACYVALAVGICWAPSVGRWHADRAASRPGKPSVPLPGQAQ